MNTKHTPGPWEVYDMQWTGTVAIAKVLSDGSRHLVVGPYIDEANARLIAAAPELLEALQAIVGKGIAGLPERYDDLTTVDVPLLVKAIWNARAAIAKATNQ